MICFMQPQHPRTGQPTGIGHPFHLDIRGTVGDIKAQVEEKIGTPVAEQVLQFSSRTLEDDNESVEDAVKHRAGAVRALNLKGEVGWDNNFWRDRSCWFYLIRKENTLWEKGDYYKGDDRYDPKTW